MPALKATMDSAAAQCGCVTVRLDGGDQMQGSLESNLVYGASVVHAFNLLGLDAAAVGNHELDWGFDTLKARQSEANYPWLAANVFLRGTRTRPPWARPFTIIERAKVRIGVIGYATVNTPATQRTATTAPYEFRGGAAGIADALDSVRAQAPDFIIVVAHAGGGCVDGRCTGEMVDLANGLDSAGVDLIVGGHDHTSGGGVVNGIPIVRASSESRAISVVDLIRTTNGHHQFALRRDTVYVDAVSPDTAMLALLAPYVERVDAIANASVATLRDSLFATQGLGTALAAAMREAVAADFGMMNPGGVRANLSAGVVRYRALFRVMPFGNAVWRIALTGRQLRDVVEHTLGANDTGATRVQRRPPFYSGLRLRYDPDAPRGNRIVSLTFPDGRPIQNDDAVTLALPDFLAEGGDGLVMLSSLRVVRRDLTLLDAFIAMLRHLPQPVVMPKGSEVVNVRQPPAPS